MATVQTTNVTAYPVVQPAAPVIVQSANPAARMNVEAVKGLAITQIVIGILTIAFGIGSIAGFEYGYWVNASGSGIWFGIWILVTGIIGLSSSKNPASNGLNGTNMGFNIVCTVVSFFVGIFYVVAVAYYSSCDELRYNSWSGYYYTTYCRNKDAGLAIYVILLIAMIAEFFISLVASVYCCQGGCCGGPTTSGVIIQPQQPAGFVTTGVVTSSQYQAYPASYPQPVQGGVYPASTAYPPQQQAGYPQYTYPGGMPVTNITYSQQQPQDATKVAPPPPYTQ